MLFLKAVAVFLAIISITKSYLDYRKKRESLLLFVFWAAVWVVSVSIVVYPPLIDKVTASFKDQTITLGSVTGVAFIFMLYIVYRVYTKAARIEYQQGELVRKLGLRDIPKKD